MLSSQRRSDGACTQKRKDVSKVSTGILVILHPENAPPSCHRGAEILRAGIGLGLPRKFGIWAPCKQGNPLL